ncbi:MAG TPA: class II D-tagatose-bisphosphate aldolase, non-catalytic subunit [Anaerovoracaceae bacterium]|nr:class II D-tagatose-bisphosphate aldolase, non-catalytic subunit [Anaerovoracaceae bacterium]
MNPVKKLLSETGQTNVKGIYSVCSANRLVLKASFLKAKENNLYALVEATANQVNQYGGYTGMKPKDFIDSCLEIADEVGFEYKNIIFGGDHLGPLVWKNESEDTAMEKAKELVRQFVEAGFTKIHIDTSMHLKSDNANEALSVDTVGRRAALLIEECLKTPAVQDLVFVIGSEVPAPGGDGSLHALKVTLKEDLVKMLSRFQARFEEGGLSDVWPDVAAVVVQPGVEFFDSSVHHYDSGESADLMKTLAEYPPLVFEGHSTDYQSKESLRQMVDDGIRILKVGPALTFHMREALFALSYIENELLPEEERSGFIEVLDNAMRGDPAYWQGYYKGSEREVELMRKFSFFDRSRYYMSDDAVTAAQEKLFENISRSEIPGGLLSQVFPTRSDAFRSGKSVHSAEDLVISRICDCLDDYLYAVIR